MKKLKRLLLIIGGILAFMLLVQILFYGDEEESKTEPTEQTAEATTESVAESTAAPSAIASPEIIELNNTTNGVEVKWNAVDGAAHYRVFYRSEGGEWTTAGNVDKTELEVTGLTDGSKYAFLVRCLNEDGTAYTSEYDVTKSKEITYQPVPEKLSTPVITELNNTAGGVEVKWNAVKGAAQYRVFYKTENGEWTAAGNTEEAGMTVTGLTAGTTYSFTVRCLSADGKTFTSDYNTTGKSVTVK